MKKPTVLQKPLNHSKDIFSKKDNLPQEKTAWILYGAIFFISFSLISYEITLSRLLSVLLSYHYVFVVLSLALLGLGMGGVFIHFLQHKAKREDTPFNLLTFFACLYSLMISFSIVIMNHLGYSDNIFFYSFLLFFPFFFAGVILAEVYHIFPEMGDRIYGVDLIGAASGSLVVIYFLNTLGGIRATFLLGVVASMSALLLGCGRGRSIWRMSMRFPL